VRRRSRTLPVVALLALGIPMFAIAPGAKRSRPLRRQVIAWDEYQACRRRRPEYRAAMEAGAGRELVGDLLVAKSRRWVLAPTLLPIEAKQ
jgi:hypothetical protein